MLNENESRLISEMYATVKALVEDASKTKEELFESLETEFINKMAKLNVVSSIEEQADKYIERKYGSLPPVYHVEYKGNVSKITGFKHKQFDRVLRKVTANVPVFIHGPAGAGKNMIAADIAKALGLDFYYINAIKQEFTLTGFMNSHGTYTETPFYKACVNGGLIMIDEIDSSIPEVLIKLNAALSNGYFDFPHKKVDIHPDTRFIVAGNTAGSGADRLYTGRNQLDASTLDRFAFVQIDYDTSVEQKIGSNYPELLNFIWELRRVIHDTNMRYVMSTRAITNSIKLLESGASNAEIVQDVILKGMSRQDKNTLYEHVNQFNNIYVQEFAKLLD